MRHLSIPWAVMLIMCWVCIAIGWCMGLWFASYLEKLP